MTGVGDGDPAVGAAFQTTGGNEKEEGQGRGEVEVGAAQERAAHTPGPGEQEREEGEHHLLAEVAAAEGGRQEEGIPSSRAGPGRRGGGR